MTLTRSESYTLYSLTTAPTRGAVVKVRKVGGGRHGGGELRITILDVGPRGAGEVDG